MTAKIAATRRCGPARRRNSCAVKARSSVLRRSARWANRVCRQLARGRRFRSRCASWARRAARSEAPRGPARPAEIPPKRVRSRSPILRHPPRRHNSLRRRGRSQKPLRRRRFAPGLLTDLSLKPPSSVSPRPELFKAPDCLWISQEVVRVERERRSGLGRFWFGRPAMVGGRGLASKFWVLRYAVSRRRLTRLWPAPAPTAPDLASLRIYFDRAVALA